MTSRTGLAPQSPPMTPGLRAWHYVILLNEVEELLLEYMPVCHWKLQCTLGWLTQCNTCNIGCTIVPQHTTVKWLDRMRKRHHCALKLIIFNGARAVASKVLATTASRLICRPCRPTCSGKKSLSMLNFDSDVLQVQSCNECQTQHKIKAHLSPQPQTFVQPNSAASTLHAPANLKTSI